MPEMSLLDRIRAQVASRAGGLPTPTGSIFTGRRPQRTRQVVKTNSFDRANYKRVRKQNVVDEWITDLDKGNEHMGGERAAFDGAPELVQGLFHMFHKPGATLASKREIERELYPVRKILEEVRENPTLVDLQPKTNGSLMMSTIALEAMKEPINEILTRVGNTPSPDSPGKGGGGGQGQPGGGGGQGQGQGQGQPDPNAPQQPGGGGGGGGGQGQPDPNQPQQPQQPPQGGQQPASADPNAQQEGQPGQPGQGGGSGAEDEDLTDTETPDFDPDSMEDEEQAEADWESAMDDYLDGLDIDRLVNKALEAAADEVEEIDNARSGIGLEDAEWRLMSPEQQLAMAERLRTPEMKALADIVGRMKRFSLGVRATRINDVPMEPYDVHYGNDLKHVLRSQFAYLGNELTKYEFYRRYAAKELLIFKLRGEEEVGKGPVVVCIDKSGSMTMGGRVTKFFWAMGVAEALRRFAADEDRDYYAMLFGTNSQRVRFDFPGGKGPFEKVLTFLSSVADGGTQFDGVLTEALAKASTSFDGEGKGKADIVFITDGMANLSEEWIADFNAERERCGVRLYSVFVTGATDISRAERETGPMPLLKKLSDAVIPVKELTPQSVKHIFEKV